MSELFNTNNNDGDYNVTKFLLNKKLEVTLHKDTIWVSDILKELNENADSKDPEQFLEETSIEIRLDLTKKFKNELSEYFLVSGEIEASYMTKCVKTLKDMPQSIIVDMKACFVDLSLEGNEQFKDQTETFIDNDLYELYFYSERKISLKEPINELIYLNINQYPILEADHDPEDLEKLIKQ
jgi:hypothetical protein